MTDGARRSYALIAVVVALAAAAIVATAVVAHRNATTSAVESAGNDMLVGTPLDPPKRATDATLLDQHGRPDTVLDKAVPITMLFFGYTRCPDECPIALASLARAFESLSPKQQLEVRIAFVTVDPAHDTPAAMGRYVAHFGAPIVALTGSRAELVPLWSAYDVDVQPQAHDLVAHGGTIDAIDAKGNIVAIYPPDVSSKDLAHDMRLLSYGPSG